MRRWHGGDEEMTWRWCVGNMEEQG